jgi:hypothetical protein
MTEPRDDRELADRTSTALRDLHVAIHERVPVPASTELRRRAERQDLTRHAGALVAAVVVLAVLVAGPERGSPLRVGPGTPDNR